jgi:hypothetical protein
MPNESFEIILTGGHPTSLGRTVKVVKLVFKDSSRLTELYTCHSNHATTFEPVQMTLPHFPVQIIRVG